ncbi:hypothetical protein MLD38_040695 [Melastoma candidum]|nr:hypothetical protein MLD38_040695 [Melastoma candidum]
MLRLLLLLLLLTAAVTSSSPSDCSSTFSCGPLTNLTYPFTGADRPSHCGPPQFRLTCLPSAAVLGIGPLDYLVLGLNQSSRSLTLSRLDLHNTTCLDSNYYNTTLDGTAFVLSPSNVNLTIFYGCSSSLPIKPTNMFVCNINGSLSDSYYLMGPIPNDPILNVSRCNDSVSVPILGSSALVLGSDRSKLREALDGGFEVEYKNPYEDQCGKCRGIRGDCGFDSASGIPLCFCGNHVCFTEGGNSTTLSVALPLAGAALAGLLVGFWIFSCRQRDARKKRAAAEQQTKDLGQTPASSKGGLPVSTPSYSRTTPSYPTSKSDLEKGSMYFGAQLFSYQELEEATDSFDPSKELGDGGFGTVYYGKLHDQREVAVKRFFGVVLCELISSKPAVDTSRHRHDINLASMAISKIQNHALHELVDPSLGFETDYSVRRMATNMAELAFRCLQNERDMRPTMKEVLEALRKIKREEEVAGIEDAEVVDIPSDEIGPLRHLHPPLSPDSSTPDKWNSSGSFPSHSF